MTWRGVQASRPGKTLKKTPNFTQFNNKQHKKNYLFIYYYYLLIPNLNIIKQLPNSTINNIKNLFIYLLLLSINTQP